MTESILSWLKLYDLERMCTIIGENFMTNCWKHTIFCLKVNDPYKLRFFIQKTKTLRSSGRNLYDRRNTLKFPFTHDRIIYRKTNKILRMKLILTMSLDFAISFAGHKSEVKCTTDIRILPPTPLAHEQSVFLIHFKLMINYQKSFV